MIVCKHHSKKMKIGRQKDSRQILAVPVTVMSQPVFALDGIGPLAAEVTVTELYPNRALLITQDYYRMHQVKFSP